MEINHGAPDKSKKDLAQELGVSRQSLYYQQKLPKKDLLLKTEIEKVMSIHKRYGHKRIALALQINKKRARRVMKLFGLAPKRNRRQPFKNQDLAQAPMTIPNLIKGMLIEAPGLVWVSDFTYLWFFGRFVYLATVEDIVTRQIVGFAVSFRHDATLVCQAMLDALEKHSTPQIAHSDQGSEYRSAKYQSLLTAAGILPSMSKKGSPWENGYQESFYSEFKLELGDPECYADLGQLVEAIALQIHYYNNLRIHTALRCPPAIFVRAKSQLPQPQPIAGDLNASFFQKIEKNIKNTITFQSIKNQLTV